MPGASTLWGHRLRIRPYPQCAVAAYAWTRVPVTEVPECGTFPVIWDGLRFQGRTSQMAVHAHRCELTKSTDSVGRPDHASAFEVTIADGDNRSPEQWARAVFEEAPRAARWFVEFGWHYVLGLRLGPRSFPDHVAGWTVRNTGPGIINLDVQSWLLTATKEIQVSGDAVRIETGIRYKRGLGRALWTLVTPVHFVTERYLLGCAASRPG
jgi:hypothetical protein